MRFRVVFAAAVFLGGCTDTDRADVFPASPSAPAGLINVSSFATPAAGISKWTVLDCDDSAKARANDAGRTGLRPGHPAGRLRQDLCQLRPLVEKIGH